MVSLKQTNSAALSVQKELYEIGLWYESTRLIKSNIFWKWMPFFGASNADGIFTIGVSVIDKIQGFEEGHIYIPKWVLAQGFSQNRATLRDIIRHEYGHVLAHYYPEMIVDSKSFEKIFGANYYSYQPTQMEKGTYISTYASTMPMEDFAETFRVFVRRKGIMPANILNKNLQAKWKFIADLCTKISSK